MAFELEMTIKLLLAVFLGSLIGYEREIKRRPAGLRTHMLVSLGSSLFTILSLNAFPGSDPSRVAAGILIGIGFIGAGTVLQTKEKIIGLTTAASLWITASIGMAVGVGFYLLAIVATIIAFLTLWMSGIEKKIH